MKIFDEDGFIDSEVQEILYELGNVGLGMVSIAIGKIMGVRMHIGIPSVMAVDDKLSLDLGDEDSNIGVIVEFQKSINGYMLFILKGGFVEEVSKKLCAEEGNFDETDRDSAIQEFVNILCAAYLKAIGQYTGIRIYVKPLCTKELNKKYFDGGQELVKLTEHCNKAISVDTGFSIVYENGVTLDDVGRVIMLPDEKSVEKLIEPLCD